jgi:hypothetical protein
MAKIFSPHRIIIKYNDSNRTAKRAKVDKIVHPYMIGLLFHIERRNCSLAAKAKITLNVTDIKKVSFNNIYNSES